MKNLKNLWSSYRYSLILLGSIIIGACIGLHMKEKAIIFKPLGDIFINGMFTIVVPLVFLTVSSAMSSMSDMKRLKKILTTLLLIFVSTGIVASILILTVVTFFPPAKDINLALKTHEAIKTFSTGSEIVKAITVSDFPELISKKNILPLLIFSLIFGCCINKLGERGKQISNLLKALSDVLLKMINVLMLYAPIGLGAYFAVLVGEYGGKLIGSYGKALLIYYPLCLLYFIIAFPIYAYIAGGKKGVISLKHIIPPAITALSTQSSLATLPVNMESCEKIGVPKDISEIVLPLGATAHMDGTVLGTVLKISFLFGVFQMPFEGIETYLSALFLSIIGGVVMSGVPGGGLIGEMLIVTMYGFPPEAFPIIATIGYLIDPPATMINASGDTVAAMLVSRFVEGKDWLKNTTINEKNDKIEEN